MIFPDKITGEELDVPVAARLQPSFQFLDEDWPPCWNKPIEIDTVFDKIVLRRRSV